MTPSATQVPTTMLRIPQAASSRRSCSASAGSRSVSTSASDLVAGALGDPGHGERRLRPGVAAPGVTEHSVPGLNHSVTQARSPRCTHPLSSSGAKVVSAAVTASTRGSVNRCSAMSANAWSSEVAVSRTVDGEPAGRGGTTGASSGTSWSAEGGHRLDLLPRCDSDAGRRREDPPALVDCDR